MTLSKTEGMKKDVVSCGKLAQADALRPQYQKGERSRKTYLVAKTEWAEEAAWWGRWPEWQEPHRVDKKPLTGFEKMNATIWLNTFCWGRGGRPESPWSLWKGYAADEKLAGWFSFVIIILKKFNFFHNLKNYQEAKKSGRNPAQRSYQRRTQLRTLSMGRISKLWLSTCNHEGRSASWLRERSAHLPGTPKIREKLCNNLLDLLNTEPLNKGIKETQAYHIKSLGDTGVW